MRQRERSDAICVAAIVVYLAGIAAIGVLLRISG